MIISIGDVANNVLHQSCIECIVACVDLFGKPHQLAKIIDFVVAVLRERGLVPVAANAAVVTPRSIMRLNLAAAATADGAVIYPISRSRILEVVQALGNLTVRLSTTVAGCLRGAGRCAACVVTGIIFIVGVIYNTAFVEVCVYGRAANVGASIYADLLADAKLKCKTSVCKLCLGDRVATVTAAGAARVTANGIVVGVSAAIAKGVTDNTTRKVAANDGAVVDVACKSAVILITGNAAKVCATGDVDIALVYTVFNNTLIYLTGNAAHTADSLGANDVAVVGTKFKRTCSIACNTAKLGEAKGKPGIYFEELNVALVGTVFDGTARVVTNDAAHSCSRCNGGIFIVTVLNETATVFAKNCTRQAAGCNIRIFNGYVLNNTARSKFGNKACVTVIGPIIKVVKTADAMSVTVKGAGVGHKVVNSVFMIHDHADGRPEAVALGLATEPREVALVVDDISHKLCICRGVARSHKVGEPHQLTCVADLIITVNQGSGLRIVLITAELTKAVLVKRGVIGSRFPTGSSSLAGVSTFYNNGTVVYNGTRIIQIAVYR